MRIEDIKNKEIRERAKYYREHEKKHSKYLNDAFLWAYTTEGYDYWLRVNNGQQQTTEATEATELSLDEGNDLIQKELYDFKIELLQKNKDYNNSLHRPNIFGQEPIEGLKARMSDKLNRILSKGLDDKTEDSMRDLFGYYIHYCIMKRSKLSEPVKQSIIKHFKEKYKG